MREGDDCAQVHMSGDSQRPANSAFCSSHQGTGAGTWGSPTCRNGSSKRLKNPLTAPGSGWAGRSWTLSAWGGPGGAGGGCPPASDGAERPHPVAPGWPGWGRGGDRNEEQVQNEQSCTCPPGAGALSRSSKRSLTLLSVES